MTTSHTEAKAAQREETLDRETQQLDAEQTTKEETTEEETTKSPAATEAAPTEPQVQADDRPQDESEEQEEPADWAKLTKTRSEAAGLRRRLRDTEAERDQGAQRIAELEARVKAFEEQEQQREVDALRRRILVERNFPEGTLELLTGTTEDEIIAELDRAEAILTRATPGPALRGTTGEVAKPADWASVVQRR